MRRQWFAASMWIFILVEGDVPVTDQDIVVHVFRARGRDRAFKRALELGRTHEADYLNAEGDRVRWRFDRVLTLDWVRGARLEGSEVYSVLGDSEAEVQFDEAFFPEQHVPGNTGI